MRWLAELRTFARPGRPEEPPPAPGELAPDESAGAAGPRLVIFLRHAGCPFAEDTVLAVEARRRQWPSAPAVLYSEAEPPELKRWLRAIGAQGSAVRADPGAFDRWRVPRTSPGHFLGPRSLRGVVRLRRRGIRNRYPSGTRWRSAAAFVVDGDGRVAWRHLPVHAADPLPVETVFSRLTDLTAHGGGGPAADSAEGPYA
ncbi:MAG: hypothetical protein AAGM22_26285 [Acidobacteriota bacterium]